MIFALVAALFVAAIIIYYRPRPVTSRVSLVIDPGGRTSPIERMFMEAYRKTGVSPWYTLQREYRLLNGKYRLDFAHVPTKTAIELDGYAWHQGQGIDKVTADYKRRRELQRLGWYFISFTGQETYTEVLALRSALELQDMLKKRNH